MFSILDYGAEVTGLIASKAMENVQHRASRIYMGAGKGCPLPCLDLEMGWLTSYRRRNLCVVKYYERILRMDNSRIPRRIFDNSRNSVGSWAYKVGELLTSLGLSIYWDIRSPVPGEMLQFYVRERCKEELLRSVAQMAKLRTYRQLVVGLTPAEHLRTSLSRGKRSLVSQLRCGILPLKLEIGRYLRIPLEDRLCELCNTDSVEDESHFLLVCPALRDVRQQSLGNVVVHGIPDLCSRPFVFGRLIDALWKRRTALLS